MDERLGDLPARALIERLSTSDPIPGGGSAAAIAGSMAAALVHMVVALTTGRPSAADHETELAEIALAAASLQSELLNLAEQDAVAYDAVVRARRLPRETQADAHARSVQVAAATQEATRVPLRTARRAGDVLTLAERLAPIGNRNAISDVGVGGLLAVAALRGAALNVRINVPSLADDDPLRADAAGELDRLFGGLDQRERDLRDAVEARLG